MKKPSAFLLCVLLPLFSFACSDDGDRGEDWSLYRAPFGPGVCRLVLGGSRVRIPGRPPDFDRVQGGRG